MVRILPTFAAAASLFAATTALAAEPSVEAARAETAAPATEPTPHAAVAEPQAVTPVPADQASDSETAREPAQLSPEDQKLVQGYKPVQRGEKTVYCRGEREADSRMKQTRCYSLNQLRNAAKDK